MSNLPRYMGCGKKEKMNIYISTFLLIYLSSGFGIGAMQGSITLFYCWGVVAYILLTNKQASTKIQLLPATCMGMAVISYTVNGEEGSQTTILISYFCMAMTFCNAYSIKRWFKVYVKVMYVICICSIILYVIDMIVPSVLTYLPTVTNSVGVEKGTILFAVTPTQNRNYGCFWEPGAFQTYLLIAFIIEVFEFKVRNKKRVVALLIALVTTFSTAGYAAVMIAIVAVMMSGFTDTALKKSARNVIIIVLIAVIAAYYIIQNFYPQLAYVLFGKLEDYNQTQNDNTSTGVRVNAIVEGFKIFLENPIFGVGKTKLKIMFINMYGHDMTTCTYVNWFAYFGIVFGCLMLYGLFMFTRNFTNRLLVRWVLFAAIMASITSENYVMNPSFLILIFYGFQAAVEHGRIRLGGRYG